MDGEEARVAADGEEARVAAAGEEAAGEESDKLFSLFFIGCSREISSNTGSRPEMGGLLFCAT